jgi:NAD(P)-dependent dehydrogenase (short-subunit alcohol dehydrogenase family)
MGSSERPTLLITGVAEGFGASIARTFAAAGHDVVGLARSDRSAAHLARLVGEGGGPMRIRSATSRSPRRWPTFCVHPKFAAFAPAKFALRGLAQSLSWEFGRQGVHVAHVVLDGLIDEPQTDARFGPAKSTRMDPDAIAQAYLALATQHRSAWTHELDLHPSSERF